MPDAAETETTRRLDFIPLDELLPADRNPKRHNDVAIAASIGKFGYVEPMVLDERTGKLVAGHGRLDALRAARDHGDELPDGVREGWQVPVLRGWASRTDLEAEAYLAASNRLTEIGGWDQAELAAMLSDIAESDAELLRTIGYDDSDLTQLLQIVERDSGDIAGPPEDEWRGLPAFDQPSKESAFHTTIHFATEELAAEFFELIGTPRSPKLWWKGNDGHVGSNLGLVYLADGS